VRRTSPPFELGLVPAMTPSISCSTTSILLAVVVAACSSGGKGGGGSGDTEACSPYDNFLPQMCLSCIHANCESQVESASAPCQCTCTDGGADCPAAGSDACMTAVDAVEKCYTQSCSSQCN
jgi:hypothetical protein